MTRQTVLVMAKAPALGRGKQRLAAGIGRAHALRVNRALQAKVLRACVDVRWRTILVATPDRATHAAFPAVWPSDVARIPQGRGDLGARLAAAFARAGHRPAVVVGVDSPDLRRADIAAAFRALRRRRYVMGPALDGGFWLLGARAPRLLRGAFAGVRWSTPHAGADMAARLCEPPALLRPLGDIDTAEDWRAYCGRCSAWRKSRGV